MSLFARLFRSRPDPRDALRPLWHRIVEISRERGWYETCGVADTTAGRFDMITAVLAMVLLRMEQEADLTRGSVLLTELFVEDMDGQLRESGVGDVVVGKHVGKLMSVLGGRLGAYREALASDDGGALGRAVHRNVTMTLEEKASDVGVRLRELHAQLQTIESEGLLAGRIER